VTVAYISHSDCGRHDTGWGHPEHVGRLRAIPRALREDPDLFHALVHTVQIQVLGLERYAELWVVNFVKTRAHFTVPLEVHAFSLASRFLRPSPDRFSVEGQVRRWQTEGRY